MVFPVSRNPSALLAALALPVLLLVALIANFVIPDDSDGDSLETSATEPQFSDSVDSNTKEPLSFSSPAGEDQVALPVARTEDTVEAPPRPDGEDASAGEGDGATTAASDQDGTSAASDANQAAYKNESSNERKEAKKVESSDSEPHDFVEHTVEVLGSHTMAAGQQVNGGYQNVGPYEIQARSTITGLQPVIEQAITDVTQRHPNASGVELERKVAKRLTELNDWKNLNSHTKENMMILTGVDIESMNKREREDTVNHLQHSPLPFGEIDEVLSPEVTINMGYTHTLDKDWTRAAHLGDGVFKIWMVSNNNNGSHTGHDMGSFKVQLTPTTSIEDARRVGNEMVENRNNNNKLYLDEAARQLLYGEKPWLDFSYMSPEEKRATYAGKGINQGGPPPGPDTPEETTTTTGPAEESTTTTAPAEETTSSTTAPVEESTTTTAPAEETSTTPTTAA